jgi:hypothetical protein
MERWRREGKRTDVLISSEIVMSKVSNQRLRATRY